MFRHADVVCLCLVCTLWQSSMLSSNCHDICMCVVNKQFELLKFICNSVYVDLNYNEISLTFTAGSVCLFDV